MQQKCWVLSIRLSKTLKKRARQAFGKLKSHFPKNSESWISEVFVLQKSAVNSCLTKKTRIIINLMGVD